MKLVFPIQLSQPRVRVSKLEGAAELEGLLKPDLRPIPRISELVVWGRARESASLTSSQGMLTLPVPGPP